MEKFGRLDLLVNNAALCDTFDAAGTCSRELWDRLLNVNLTGTFLTTKAAVKIMEPQASGTIINIGSNASIYGSNAGIAYTRNTAAYYGPKGINCLMLQLGGLQSTNITDAFAQGFHAEGMQLMQCNFPGFKQGETDVRLEDVAKFCVFVASNRDIARTMNGASVPFNKNWPAA